MQSRTCQKQLVLAIDDDPAIRTLLQAALPIGGLQVLLAANGLDGIEIFKCRHDEIGVVLLDVWMPGLNGIEACRLLRKLDPAMPICFMTGNYADEISADVREFHVPLLQKPFELVTLLDALHRLISSRASAPRE